MKRILALICFLVTLTVNLQAQETGVEKSETGIQTGLFGIWGYNEAKINDELVLRTEVGFDAGIFSGFYDDKVGFLLAPVLTLEPRWYYNIIKRARKKRKTINNSANFLALEINYHPDLFVISDHDVYVNNQVAFIPKWGIKRTLGRHFVYEVGIGVGYMLLFDDKSYTEVGEAVGDLHLRIGYSF